MFLVRRAVIAVAVALAAIYAGDFLSLRLQIPSRPQTENVVIHPYYAVPQKDPGHEELMFLDPRTEVCVHSLFPQMGHHPCWYVKKHTQKRIDI